MYNKQSYEDDSKEELFCQETNNTQVKDKKKPVRQLQQI